MLEFMQMGGVVMWLILLFGLLTLGVAAAHVRRPDDRREGFFSALSKATLFATLSGVAAGFATVLHKIPATPEWAKSPDLHLILMTGFGEALSNAVLGFSLLGVAWFLFAFGVRRAH